MDDTIDIVTFLLGAAASIIILYRGYKNLTNAKNSIVNTDGTSIKYKNTKKFKWTKISTIFGCLIWSMYLFQSLSHTVTPITSILQSPSHITCQATHQLSQQLSLSQDSELSYPYKSGNFKLL